MNTLVFDPPVIAHRGASGYAPENTMAAFFKAAQMGIKWVEFDVMQASCGTPIVFHDESLERTTKVHGRTIQFPFLLLEQFDAGSWFHPAFASERILSLEQLLTFLCERKINANIEIKSLPGHEEVLVKQVLRLLDRFVGQLPTILFSSFSIDALSHLRQFSPKAFLGLLLHDWQPGWQDKANALNCISLHIYEEILTRDYALQIKSMNKYLLSYTVNTLERAQQFFSWGVDAVFSDFPDRILNANR